MKKTRQTSAMKASDTLVQEDLKKNEVVMAAFAYHTVMCDQRIQRKPMNIDGARG